MPRGRTHVDLTDFAGRKVFAVGADDLHLAGERAADRTAVREPLGAGDDRRRLCFGTRVQLPDRIRAEPLDPLFLEPRRARRGEVPHRTQRGDVVAVAHVLRQFRDARHHRRHDVHRVGLPSVDELERLLRVEAATEHDVVAREQRGRGPHERTVVVQRARHQVRAVDRHHQQRVRVRVDEPGPAGEDQLRPARAPAGRHRLERIGDRVGERPVVDVFGRRPTEGQARAFGMVIRLRPDDHLRVGELHDLVELALRQPGRDRLRGRADLPARNRRGHELHAVRQRDRDEVARLDAETCQLAGRAVRQTFQLAAGHGAVLVGDGEVLGIACGVIRDALRVGDHRHGRILTAPAPAVPAPGSAGCQRQPRVSSAANERRRATASGSATCWRRSARLSIDERVDLVATGAAALQVHGDDRVLAVVDLTVDVALQGSLRVELVTVVRGHESSCSRSL